MPAMDIRYCTWPGSAYRDVAIPAGSRHGYFFLSIEVAGICQLDFGLEDVNNQGSRWMDACFFPLRSNLTPYLLFLTAIYSHIGTISVKAS